MRAFLIFIIVVAIAGVAGVFYFAGVADSAAGEPAQQRIEVDVDLSR